MAAHRISEYHEPFPTPFLDQAEMPLQQQQWGGQAGDGNCIGSCSFCCMFLTSLSQRKFVTDSNGMLTKAMENILDGIGLPLSGMNYSMKTLVGGFFLLCWLLLVAPMKTTIIGSTVQDRQPIYFWIGISNIIIGKDKLFLRHCVAEKRLWITK
jgi:hypothetical protein